MFFVANLCPCIYFRISFLPQQSVFLSLQIQEVPGLHAEATGEHNPQNKLLEVSSKNTQTDIQPIPPHLAAGSEAASSVWQQNGKTEQLQCEAWQANETGHDRSKKSTASPNHQQPRNNKPQKTHRILINLDDKNRFTEEVTV